MKDQRVSTISVIFGILASASIASVTKAEDFRQPNQPIEAQFDLLAKGIKASYVTREIGQDADQMAFWPHGSERPTHLAVCIEERLECLSGNCAVPFQPGDKLQPAVQMIDLRTEKVTTIVRGMTICDGIRTTPWGSLVATEEDFSTDIGGLYEILDPLSGDEFTVLERGGAAKPATIIDQNGMDATDRIRKWTPAPVIRWEGLYIDPTGVVIGGDEERPGSYRNGDTDGGAIFKFIPKVLRTETDEYIESLEDSPFAAGSSYALQVSCRDNRQQFGQGCEIGAGTWVPLTETEGRIGREAANDAGATGYYRPEDLHVDPLYHDENNPNAIRFCFAATGNQAASNYGEVQCAVDQDVTAAGGPTGSVVINRFIEGNPELNQPDNLAFQPKTGNLYIIEDNPNGDVWACLPDGDDKDIKSDGCVRLLTLADPSTEPTGLIFTPNGRKAYFNIQHSDDGNMPLVDDFRTDDMVLLTGFKVRRVLRRGFDFGLETEHYLNASSKSLFGFGKKY